VDAIEFVPIPDGQIRNAALEAGDIDLMHTFNAADIGTRWRDQRDAGQVNMLASEAFAEVTFAQLNQTQPPFRRRPDAPGPGPRRRPRGRPAARRGP
jgi:ABC-type transport system substrate-binding protein